MNQFARRGSTRRGRRRRSWRSSIEARDRIPRQALRRRWRERRPGFSAERYLGDGQITEAGDSSRSIDQVLAANPGTSRRTAPASRACSASSSAR
jgi:hypothetical protein